MRLIISLKTGQTAINVLPTGARKSILFMLPAVIREARTSIVVVPFMALMDNLVTRATAIGVDYIQFRSSLHARREGIPRAARLVVISADIISSAKFLGYIDGYRAKLGELQSLHQYGCLIVLLTATLPVVLKEWFRREILA
ncbi:hypothetical protein LCI18_002794 [Fusarium solani-melongenae]|uniref:Uncharacterized protein n=2 Tax=Fusarium solani subsp. cucurbitae TaxID=2747967 RepID=A0ACD3YSC1_FUSSC|nr:hypothetical protein LCI18_001650 [Fusarium solani-melongenae]UPK91859.1 hypothetical protein LCI18_002794 [Fusarium solani-melongenae]